MCIYIIYIIYMYANDCLYNGLRELKSKDVVPQILQMNDYCKKMWFIKSKKDIHFNKYVIRNNFSDVANTIKGAIGLLLKGKEVPYSYKDPDLGQVVFRFMETVGIKMSVEDFMNSCGALLSISRDQLPSPLLKTLKDSLCESD
jgi:hypothetical protein